MSKDDDDNDLPDYAIGGGGAPIAQKKWRKRVVPKPKRRIRIRSSKKKK